MVGANYDYYNPEEINSTKKVFGIIGIILRTILKIEFVRKDPCEEHR